MSPKAKSLTYELVITSKNPSVASLEIIKGVLVTQGISLEEIVEVDEKPFLHLSVFFKSRLKAESLQSRLRQLKIKQITLKINKLERQEWFNKFKSEFKPFKLTKRIRVIPVWEKAPKEHGNVKNLMIDTGFAFGSGMHPSTKFLAALIERCSGKFKSFFDIGAGSGILTLVALLNGAESVCAIDISQDAVRSTKDNLKRNHLIAGNVSKKDIDSYNSKNKFDFIAANLITQDLISLKRKIISFMKPKGLLAVSGISINNYSLFKKAFKTLPLRCLKVEKGEGWCALLYKKI